MKKACGAGGVLGYIVPCAPCLVAYLITALWYNGSTSDSGSECQGSNPCRATKTCYYIKMNWQVFSSSYLFILNSFVMKKFSFLLLLLFVSYLGFSQKCGDYYYLQCNKTIEMTISNKKGKEGGKLVYVISNVGKKGNISIATVNSELFDKNGK